ncbi:MAG: hypothetical protein ACYS6W_17750 [Planctomycetota bacterium]|jgi:hypothetical protein
MIISYEFKDDKYINFKTAFIKVNAVPLDGEMQPIMTEDEWIEQWGYNQFMKAYEIGVRQTARENAIIDEPIESPNLGGAGTP